jgi:uncharacterized protein (TIGR03067 family)
MTWSLPAVAAALLLAAAPLAAGDAKGELEMFQGLWAVAAETSSGIAVPAERLKGRQLEVKGHRYTAKSPATGGELGTLALDSARKPKVIDMTPSEGPNTGMPRHGIYEVDGDTLRVCYAAYGKARPTAFASRPDSGVVLVTYRRVKR